MTIDVYQLVTNQILSALESGTVPWRNPILAGPLGQPRNLASNRPYRGINVFLLALTAQARGYGSCYWLTFRQAHERSGSVRKGEKSTMVVFWKEIDVEDQETQEVTKFPILRYYRVFNADQCDGITPPDAPPTPNHPFEPIEQAEAVVQGYQGPTITHRGRVACYHPLRDTVMIPPAEQFTSGGTYYATLFHELVHSTGHSSRLKRGLDETLAPFGSRDYSREELVAEMGAAFLCGHVGILPATLENSAAYIRGWMERLRGDKRLVVRAAGAAQRAADWILGATGAPEEAEQGDDQDEVTV